MLSGGTFEFVSVSKDLTENKFHKTVENSYNEFVLKLFKGLLCGIHSTQQ